MMWKKKRLTAPKLLFYKLVNGWPYIPKLDCRGNPHFCSRRDTRASLVVGHQYMFVELIN